MSAAAAAENDERPAASAAGRLRVGPRRMAVDPAPHAG
jgi:hypothetical protein